METIEDTWDARVHHADGSVYRVTWAVVRMPNGSKQQVKLEEIKEK